MKNSKPTIKQRILRIIQKDPIIFCLVTDVITHSSLVFSAFSIISARWITSTIICCSEELRGSGCFQWLRLAVFTDQPEWSLRQMSSDTILSHS